MKQKRRKIISIIGTADATLHVLSFAEKLGELMVDNDYRIATGGLTGIMEAVSRGAHNSNNYKEGDVIGVIPGFSKNDANPFVDIVIPTGMGYARNMILVSMGEAVVAIAGGSGTLSEISMAWQYNKPIIAIQFDVQGEINHKNLADLTESVGFRQNIGWSSVVAGIKLDDKRGDKIYSAKSPDEVIKFLAEILK